MEKKNELLLKQMLEREQSVVNGLKEKGFPPTQGGELPSLAEIYSTPLEDELLKPEAFRQPNRLDLMSQAEKAITEAMYKVEESGASENLTKAVILLGNARDLVYEHFRTTNRPQ